MKISIADEDLEGLMPSLVVVMECVVYMNNYGIVFVGLFVVLKWVIFQLFNQKTIL